MNTSSHPHRLLFFKVVIAISLIGLIGSIGYSIVEFAYTPTPTPTRLAELHTPNPHPTPTATPTSINNTKYNVELHIDKITLLRTDISGDIAGDGKIQLQTFFMLANQEDNQWKVYPPNPQNGESTLGQELSLGDSIYTDITLLLNPYNPEVSFGAIAFDRDDPTENEQFTTDIAVEAASEAASSITANPAGSFFAGGVVGIFLDRMQEKISEADYIGLKQISISLSETASNTAYPDVLDLYIDGDNNDDPTIRIHYTVEIHKLSNKCDNNNVSYLYNEVDADYRHNSVRASITQEGRERSGNKLYQSPSFSSPSLNYTLKEGDQFVVLAPPTCLNDTDIVWWHLQSDISPEITGFFPESISGELLLREIRPAPTALSETMPPELPSSTPIPIVSPIPIATPIPVFTPIPSFPCQQNHDLSLLSLSGSDNFLELREDKNNNENENNGAVGVIWNHIDLGAIRYLVATGDNKKNVVFYQKENCTSEHLWVTSDHWADIAKNCLSVRAIYIKKDEGDSGNYTITGYAGPWSSPWCP